MLLGRAYDEHGELMTATIYDWTEFENKTNRHCMRICPRIFVVVLLAVFVAGTVANAAIAIPMSADMSLAPADDAGMAGCFGCSLDCDEVTNCDQVCVVPFAAIAPFASLDLPAIAPRIGIGAAARSVGRTGPPDPAPPRAIFLI